MPPPRLNRRSVAMQVRDDLRKRMATGEVASGSQMPSEAECCTTYGVSRTTVREAYRLLEQEGLIEVRPGKGRFALSNVQRQIEGSVSIFRSMSDYLADAGYDATTKVVQLLTRSPSVEEAKLFELDPDDTVVELERVRLSDDQLIVHSVNVFDPRLLGAPIDDYDWSGSLVQIFRDHGHETSSAIVDIKAVNLTDDMADRYGLSTSNAWLRLSGPAFDKSGRPLWWSKDTIRGDVRTLRIVNRSESNDD